jgi:hypothetical protein
LEEISNNVRSLYKINAVEVIANNVIKYCKDGKS